jgi:hypothetical protein
MSSAIVSKFYRAVPVNVHYVTLMAATQRSIPKHASGRNLMMWIPLKCVEGHKISKYFIFMHMLYCMAIG